MPPSSIQKSTTVEHRRAPRNVPVVCRRVSRTPGDCLIFGSVKLPPLQCRQTQNPTRGSQRDRQLSSKTTGRARNERPLFWEAF